MSTSLMGRVRRVFLLGCVSGAAFVVLGLGQAAVASADSTSVYPPEAQSRTFTGGVGNWESATEQEGLLGGVLCKTLPGVACPVITNKYVDTGGVDGGGDGFIETSEGGLAGVGLLELATSTGIYESPAFTYGGAAGQAPTSVELTLARRANVAGLLAVSGATADYTVEMVDESSPSGTVIVTNAAPLAGAENWKTLSASVSPSALTVGHSYKIRIATTFNTPALIVPEGGAGYDNVALTATKVEAANGGNGGGSGNNGGGGNNGARGNGGGAVKNEGSGNGAAGGISGARLESVMRSSSLVGSAGLSGNRLTVKAKCPAKLHATCTLRLQGMLSRRTAATAARRARLKAGKAKHFAMVVKPAARAKVRAKKRILVKEIARVGKVKVTVFKALPLVRKK